MTIGNPPFCLAPFLTAVHFRGELQPVGRMSGQNIRCQPIRTREIGGVRLQDELYKKSRRIEQHVSRISKAVTRRPKRHKHCVKSV